MLCSYGAFRALLTALFADSTQICSLLGRAGFYDQTRGVPSSVSASLGVASGNERRVTGLQLQVYVTGLYYRSMLQVYSAGLCYRSMPQVYATGLYYRSMPQICVTGLQLQVCATGLCGRSVCDRSMLQVCAIGLCYRSILLVCGTGLCCRSVLQVFVTGLCHRSVSQFYITGLCYRSTLQVCVTGLYYRSVLQVYAAGLGYRSMLPVHARDSPRLHSPTPSRVELLMTSRQLRARCSYSSTLAVRALRPKRLHPAHNPECSTSLGLRMLISGIPNIAIP